MKCAADLLTDRADLTSAPCTWWSGRNLPVRLEQEPPCAWWLTLPVAVVQTTGEKQWGANGGCLTTFGRHGDPLTKLLAQLAEIDETISVWVKLVEERVGLSSRHLEAERCHCSVKLIAVDQPGAIRIPIPKEVHDSNATLGERLAQQLGNRLAARTIELDSRGERLPPATSSKTSQVVPLLNIGPRKLLQLSFQLEVGELSRAVDVELIEDHVNVLAPYIAEAKRAHRQLKLTLCDAARTICVPLRKGLPDARHIARECILHRSAQVFVLLDATAA